MKRLVVATAFLVALAAPAFAQQKPYGAMSDDEKAKAKVAESVDKQYRNAIDNTRKEGSEVTVDPWANMRGADNSSSKPKR